MKKQGTSENQVKIAYLGIGSNLGNRLKNIDISKFKLQSQNIKIIKCSSNYETISWPDVKNPKFINIVIKVETYFSANKLLKICNKIENELGRKRFKKNDPRTCDIDIIDYDQKVIKFNRKNYLNIPHSETSKRCFVLIPLYEISKTWKHPKTKVNINKLISLLKIDDLRAIKKI